MWLWSPVWTLCRPTLLPCTPNATTLLEGPTEAQGAPTSGEKVGEVLGMGGSTE